MILLRWLHVDAVAHDGGEPQVQHREVMRMGTRIALIASLAASCAAMSRGALLGSNGSVYTSEQAPSSSVL